MALTRIPRALVSPEAKPIRWTGTATDRAALLPSATGDSKLTASDVGYLFFETPGNVFYVLSSISGDTVTWTGGEAASSAGGAIGIDKVTGLQSALDSKLEKGDIDVTASTGLSITKGEDDNSITLAGVDATDAVKGIVKLASADELTAGTSTTAVVTVANITSKLADRLTADNITVTEATGVKATKSGNDITVEGVVATTTAKGTVRFATADEITAGTETGIAVSVKNLADVETAKLNKNFAGFTALDALADATVLAVQDGEDNKKVTAEAIKTYVLKDVDSINRDKGYFATKAALEAAWDGTTEDKTPEPGSYAIVEATDSVWVWDNDKKEWQDTRITGVVPVTREVTAGTGLTGGGALSDDVTLAVSYGTTAGTAAEGNDARFNRKPVIDVASGTALSALELEDYQANYLFRVTGGASDAFETQVYECTDVENKTFVLVSEVLKTQKVKVFDGVVSAGETNITINEAVNSSSYINVYLGGIRQGDGAYTIAFNASTTVITLSEALDRDISYSIEVFPLVKYTA